MDGPESAADTTIVPAGSTLHRYLVLRLRHEAPWGERLTEQLMAIDVEDHYGYDGPHPGALALVDGITLSPDLLASVRELPFLDFDDIALVWHGHDGEDDPFPLRESAAHLLALPNLERFEDWDSYEPFDPTPLLAHPRLREVSFQTHDNRRAVELLESAGFHVVSSVENGTTTMERPEAT